MIRELDLKQVKAILSRIGFNSAVLNVYRFKRREGDDRIPPIRVTLIKEINRDDILRSAHKLSKTGFNRSVHRSRQKSSRATTKKAVKGSTTSN